MLPGHVNQGLYDHNSWNSLEEFVDHLLRVVEGEKYTNTINDRGGRTKWGITYAAYRHYMGSQGLDATIDDHMKLSFSDAQHIMLLQYGRSGKWDFADQDIFPVPIAILLFDTAVHSGVARAVMLLQKAINIYNKMVQSSRLKLKVDGAYGPNTDEQFQRIITDRQKDHVSGFNALLYYMAELRILYLIDIVQDDASQVWALEGWYRRVAAHRPALQAIVTP